MWCKVGFKPYDPYPKGHGYFRGLIIDDFAFKTYITKNTPQLLNYSWDFDASNGLWWETGAAQDATGPTPTHIYGDNGIFTVTLRVTDEQNLTDFDTCNVTVQNVDPTVTIESVSMNVEIGLRVAGRKFNYVSITLYEDGNPIGNVTVERMPGSPDEQIALIPISINFSRYYNATVTYAPKDPPNIGGNPVWIYIKSQNGSIKKIHHTFNVQQSKKKDSDHWNHVEPWEVGISAHLVGCSFEVSYQVTDLGSDDEILTFTYGSQNATITHFNNPPNPDPYPSPEVSPADITETASLIYEGPGIVTLIAKDDDNIRLGIGQGLDSINVA
jgi:PKD repeat protein